MTSGGIEKVSNGEEGKKSPFAEILIKVLTENVKQEYSFAQLAQDVIVNFNKGRKQTPNWGSLKDLGHEGGTFIFEIKTENTRVTIGDQNDYLKKKLNNLFIPLNSGSLNIIKQLEAVAMEKNDLVRAQKYEAAAQKRDTEKRLEQELKNAISDNINDIIKNIKPNEKMRDEVLALEKEVEGIRIFNSELEKQYKIDLYELKEKIQKNPEKYEKIK